MISRVFTWYLMLKKRLLKKTGFMVILFMIPIFSLVFALCSKEDGGGFLRIALAVEDADDKIAVEMMEKINDDSKVFKYVICDSSEAAKRKVEAAQADAAWVFVEDMETQLKGIGLGEDRTLVKIYESEESSFLKIAREKIFAVLYPYIAYYVYEDYVTTEMLPDENLDEETLKSVYEVVGDEDGFLEFETLNSEEKSTDETNFLTSTIRGLLMVIMLLAGIASTMYFLRDEGNGVYSWIAVKKRIFILWGHNFAALSLAGVFVTAALILGGNYTTFWRESVAMILFILMASAFCSILGSIFHSINILCIVLPTVLVACIVFCPIFINTHVPLQQILPPYLYLFAIHDVNMWKWMILYCVIAYPIGYILNRRKV